MKDRPKFKKNLIWIANLRRKERLILLFVWDCFYGGGATQPSELDVQDYCMLPQATFLLSKLVARGFLKRLDGGGGTSGDLYELADTCEARLLELRRWDLGSVMS